MGTTRKPPSPPSKMRKGTATHTLLMKFISTTSRPMAMPMGITRVATSRRMRIDATMAPTAVPMATTPTSADACVVL